MLNNCNIVRYSNVWEDYKSIKKVIASQQKVENVLIIASGGENIFNLLSQHEFNITAFDANPFQIEFIKLKIEAIETFTRLEYFCFLGLTNDFSREDLLARLKSSSSFQSEIITYGALFIGKLEKYFAKWSDIFKEIVGYEGVDLFNCTNLTEQQNTYNKWDVITLEKAFKNHFNEKNLGTGGRDPEMYKQVTTLSEEQLWNRFKYACNNIPANDNFYLELFLTGKISKTELPPYLKTDHLFELLKTRLHLITLHTATLDELSFPTSTVFDIGIFSNIFEYTSKEQNDKTIKKIAPHIKEGGSICYWNLFVDYKARDENPSFELMKSASTEIHNIDRSWYYSSFVFEKKKLDNPESIPYRGHYSKEAYTHRHQWLETKTNTNLSNLADDQLDPSILKGNIENYIGTVKIPIGVAGPLHINGDFANGIFYAPFATTEGALLASITRGSKALTEAGGVTTKVISQRMVRGPVFELHNLTDAYLLKGLIENSFSDFHQLVQQTTNHGKLINTRTYLTGKNVHVRFEFTTGDASGQNMTTTCTDKICKWLIDKARKEGVEIVKFYIEGGIGGDKRTSYENFINGRGTHVVAEAFVPEHILKKILRTDSKNLTEFIHQIRNGGIRSGVFGFNINTPNVVAAIFAATGQDIACLQESAVSLFDIKATEDGIYCFMEMPSLIVGTVGGGTALPSQNTGLKMIGCAGEGGAKKLAEIIVSFALALDLSTASAIASGQFASAHEKLGKNRPELGFKKTDFDLSFFKNIEGLNRTFSSVNLFDVNTKNSILSALTSSDLNKFCGHIGVELTSKSTVETFVLKVKPTNSEICKMIEKMAHQYSTEIGELFVKHKNSTFFNFCTSHELEFYKQHKNSPLAVFIPTIEAIIDLPTQEKQLILMEDLSCNELIDGINEKEKWTLENTLQAITDLAEIHSILKKSPNAALLQPTVESRKNALEFYTTLWQQHLVEFELLKKHKPTITNILSNVNHSLSNTQAYEQQLIHNDFNPRNICLQKNSNHICVYDWELITVGNKWTDVIEFLCFVDETLLTAQFIDKVLHCYAITSSTTINTDELKDVLIIFISTRLGLYFMAHNLKEYDFLPRITHNAIFMYNHLNNRS